MKKQNPISQLAEIIQARDGENIETAVISKSGADHDPVIEVSITLPSGKVYTATGGNKRIAKRIAAEIALKEEGLL